MLFVCAVRAATQVWDSAANLTKSVSDRLDWDTVQSYPKAALERVSTMAGKAKGTPQHDVQQDTK